LFIHPNAPSISCLSVLVLVAENFHRLPRSCLFFAPVQSEPFLAIFPPFLPALAFSIMPVASTLSAI